jgi:hypothetical protein
MLFDRPKPTAGCSASGRRRRRRRRIRRRRRRRRRRFYTKRWRIYIRSVWVQHNPHHAKHIRIFERV